MAETMAVPTLASTEDANIDTGCPLTIPEWKAAQASGDGLGRLLALQASQAALNSSKWIALATPSQITAQWQHLESMSAAQPRHLSQSEFPLFGVPFAIKDNIDAAGFPTTAACPAFARGTVNNDSAVVAKLKAAGAILLGKTNLDQFATGLVGTRSPYGAVGNAFDERRISGGSSAGSAVVVAKGIVPFSLGTDTAGSGRVPAGLNNIIGLKPTRGAISAAGVVPACRSLDCVSVFALTVEDAEEVLSVAEGFDAADAYSRKKPEDIARPPSSPRIAVCRDPDWFGHRQQEAAYGEALEKATEMGWTLEQRDFSLLFELASLLYEGPWVAERYAAIREFIESHEDELDPTVRAIILKARQFTAADLFAAEYRRQTLTREIERAFGEFDAILVPTTPTFPTIEAVAAEPVKENSILGTYTNFVNFMDWTALSIPASFRSDGLPFGITLIADTWQEPTLLAMARQWLSTSSRLLGATQARVVEPLKEASKESWFPIAVVGAHLTGLPLNKDLTSRAAVLEKKTNTSSSYRLFLLNTDGKVKKPGLKRVSDEGVSIEVEVWRLPKLHAASFLSTIPFPLGIGRVELLDGTWVHGFICEPYGLEGARDISSFGGWRNFMASRGSDTSMLERSARGIKSVLVANRGEIAVRIVKTLQAMGLKAIAVYSQADAKAPHVRDADVSLALEGTKVSETYLDGDQIIRLATCSGADAIIPGYGFLAENADFAAAVETAGMVWIGPTPNQMRDLGLKHLAREVAVSTNVPTVPGSIHLLKTVDEALTAAEKITYPVMLKSTAGGGGIGLRRCDDTTQLAQAFDSVQNLARANFGDAGVFVEHFVEHARHIEVQVLGDGRGNVISAGERDCSLQRRNQKVIEESPATFVPRAVRESMRDAAVRLAAAVKYRNVGTVEFIYDVDEEEFYFLEVNARLQVEHPVTEMVTGLDLVEAMVRIASGDSDALFEDNKSTGAPVYGSSIEVRIYAESPLQNFRPSPGRLLDVVFPDDVRVDTWVEPGTEMSYSYDPLIAKIIAQGEDRDSALGKLVKALERTTITGVETNLTYLRQIITSELFQSGEFITSSLDSFGIEAAVIEVVEPGTETTVQDFPGRKGFWSIGVPPSGPFDDYSFRLANQLVGNKPGAAGLEMTAQGPLLLFHSDAVVAITGAEAEVKLDGHLTPTNARLTVRKGQNLSIGMAINGYRTYLAVLGGIDVPVIFGSRSTFALGNLGGHNGRNIRSGDLLPLASSVGVNIAGSVVAPQVPIPAQPSAVWRVAVIPGPHGAPDFFTREGLETLFKDEWSVHYNSNRIGIRLSGPMPQWARQNGGGAGLHPSNVHDTPYSVGSISFTGDEAVILTCDGPSLGGFVVFCVVASAELWKLGQMRPGDRVKLHAISAEEALKRDLTLTAAIENLTPLTSDDGSTVVLDSEKCAHDQLGAPSTDIGASDSRVICRQAGERAMLLEFGGVEDEFSLRTSFEIFAFINLHNSHHPIPGVAELCPGVRTLHIQYAPGIPPRVMIAALRDHALRAGAFDSLPSRHLRLPLALDDSVSTAAVARYAATIRDKAPWLPSNVDFLAQLNGLPSQESIFEMLLQATFVVVGLGDVFLGSPCAVPLDPRHRLFGTKYNPSRSFTPRGAVGIGGNYMCIYGMDSPGGYQLVGRTVPIWDDVVAGAASLSAHKDPCTFRVFDRISFYRVAEAELDSSMQGDQPGKLVQVEDGTISLREYETWLETNRADVNAVVEARKKAILNAPFLDELLKPYENSETKSSQLRAGEGDDQGVEGERVRAQMPGRCWKREVNEGDLVQEGDTLVSIESNKMELKIASPSTGRIAKVFVEEGDIVGPYDALFVVATA